jgi:arabinogalactan oligomer/maltooligosaccharide transport system permease protein
MSDGKRKAKKIKKSLPAEVKLSCLFMGLGQLRCGQLGKGILLLLLEVAFIFFFIFSGIGNLYNLITLGTLEADPIMGIAGDNSVRMLTMGIFTIFLFVLYSLAYFANIKDILYTSQQRAKGGHIKTFRESCSVLLNGKFYFATLTIPLLFVCIFNIMPIFFTASVAFTNYGGTFVPPKLISWVGIDNFRKIFTISEYVNTILMILLWNLFWAAVATFLNYFGGLVLALLYNSKLLKGKRLWRTFPMLAYAIPSFITLIGFRFLFSDSGPVIGLLKDSGIITNTFSFLGFDAKWTIRIIGFAVCAWISIPSIMFLATGILSNASPDVYEAAKLDGATAFEQFRYITLPFVLFATMPVVISSFIGNFNNFSIFYFLRGITYMDGYFYASNTDLLINWMFNLTVDKKLYALGSALSLLLFVFMAVFSLAVYMNSSAYKKEDTYK